MQRYKEKITNSDNVVIFETHYIPGFPESDKDIYIYSKRGDRLDNLAYKYYNDQTLWWVIARCNNLMNGTLIIPPGLRIRIPEPYNILDIDDQINDMQFAT